MQLLDSESNVEMLQMETSTLSQKVEGLEKECEERSHQANTWYQALQVRRKGRGGGRHKTNTWCQVLQEGRREPGNQARELWGRKENSCLVSN